MNRRRAGTVRRCRVWANSQTLHPLSRGGVVPKLPDPGQPRASSGFASATGYRLFEVSDVDFRRCPNHAPSRSSGGFPIWHSHRDGHPDFIDKIERVREWPPYPTSRMRLLVALDWMLGRDIDPVNLRLCFYGPWDQHEPLAVATRKIAERGIAVVVAARNRGPEPDTLQELARPPWVFAVGATDGRGVLQADFVRQSAEGLPTDHPNRRAWD